MESESRQPKQIDPDQIQLIIARLRKIRGMQLGEAGESDAFIRVQERLESIITVLEDAAQSRAVPVDLRDLALRLEVVEELCASSRLINVANVLNSVRDSLLRIAAPESEREQSVPRRYQPPAPAAVEPLVPRQQPSVPLSDEIIDEPWPETHGQPLLLPLVLLCSACGACLAWVVGRELLAQVGAAAWITAAIGLLLGALLAWLRRHNLPRAARMAGAGPKAHGGPMLGLVVLLWCLGGLTSMAWMVLGTSVHQARQARILPTPTVAIPTAPPVPRPTQVVAVPTPSFEEVAARVPEEIELAAAALQDGDLGRTMEHFALAAALDPHHRLVVDMAQNIADALLDLANTAMGEGKWDLAQSRIDEARILASRFYLDTGRIDRVARRFRTMDRFEIIGPKDTAGIRNAVGYPVQITLTSYEVLRGRLARLDGKAVVVQVYSGVGEGGQVQFDKQVPLSTIREIRVYGKSR